MMNDQERDELLKLLYLASGTAASQQRDDLMRNCLYFIGMFKNMEVDKAPVVNLQADGGSDQEGSS